MFIVGLSTSMDSYFYANACYVCRVYGEKVDLKRCSRCKMIAYCSREHQIYHWPHHKEFCRVISDHLKQNGMLYRTVDNLENEEIWKRERAKLIDFVEFKLGRKLLFHEALMLHFPRSCEICHETNLKELSNCNDCPNACFCDKHPKDRKHSAVCKKLKLTFESNFVMSNVPHYRIPENHYNSLPQNMNRAIKLYEPSFNNEFVIRSKKVWACTVAECLTRPYTILWSMEKLSLPELQKMTVHVVGANVDDIEKIFYWQDILRYMKHLEELNIVFVGPDLKEDRKSLQTPSGYRVNDRRLNFQYVEELYADFAASRSFVKPDYVVGFHLETFESCCPENSTWTTSLKILGQLGCPFSITSSPTWKAHLDHQRISDIFGKRIHCFWAGKNPFASLKPYRHLVTSEFYYQNQYITIYKKLA